MANTCRGLDASAPKEVLDVLRANVARWGKKRGGPSGEQLDGGDYCLMDLLSGPRCACTNDKPSTCIYGPIVNVGKSDPKKKVTG